MLRTKLTKKTEVSEIIVYSDFSKVEIDVTHQGLVELWLPSKCRDLLVIEQSSFGWLASGIPGTHPMIAAVKPKVYVKLSVYIMHQKASYVDVL
jgi:hypothetical protein